MTNRLRPRSIARQINHKRTLPQRLWREWCWLCRDVRDIRAEFLKLAKHDGPDFELRPYQSEMTDKDIAHDGF